MEIEKSDLHSLLSSNVLDSTALLTKIIQNFPEAISFAPGAPFSDFFDHLDISDYFDRYVAYIMKERGISLAQARQWLYQYGSSQGQINELIAKALLRNEGIIIEPKAIVTTVGCQEGMLLILRTLSASSKDILVVVQPCFIGIIGAAQFLNMEVQAINENEGGLDMNRLRSLCQTARLQRKRVRALYVAPDFSNPSGTLLDLETRNKLLQLAEEEDFLILEDSTYGFTAIKDTALPTLKKLDKHARVVFLGTFSKTYLPATRVGFVVADQLVNNSGKIRFLAEELAAIKTVVTVNTSPICQAIIGGILLENDSFFAPIIQEKIDLYQRNLRLLLDALEYHLHSKAQFPYEVSWNKPSGGFFVKMSLPVKVSKVELDISARQYGVLWTPMSSFYIDDIGSNEIRLSCSYLKPAEIDEGIRRLASFLQDPCVNRS